MTGFIFGLIGYGVFLTAFLYLIGFVGNFIVPKSIDSGPVIPFNVAILVNAALLALFAVQHSAMARPAFKRWWAKIVPPSVERSAYVMLSSSVLLILFWKWQAMTEVIWTVENQFGRFILQACFWLGWLMVAGSTFMISHLDLFGLRQVYLRIRNIEYLPIPFRMTAFYRYVRHPSMLGFLIAFWASPLMTIGHLFFSIFMTGYIFIGIYLEERDSLNLNGDVFDQYRQEVPMIVPFFCRVMRLRPVNSDAAPSGPVSQEVQRPPPGRC